MTDWKIEFRKKLAEWVIIPNMGGSTDGQRRLSSGPESWNSVDELMGFIDQLLQEQREEMTLEMISGTDKPLMEKLKGLLDHSRVEGREKIEEFEYKVNRYDISSDAIDDDNGMLKDLIKDCKELIDSLKHPTENSVAKAKEQG